MSNERSPAFILRTNEMGEVVGLNEQAESLVGREAIGRSCDQVVRALTPEGSPDCRPGCAAGLAGGTEGSCGRREVKIRGRRVELLCQRVGREAVVVGETLEAPLGSERLTRREKEVLALVSHGLSTGSIATELGISAATVRTHVEHARGRLGARTRAEAVLRAVQTGQLPRSA